MTTILYIPVEDKADKLLTVVPGIFQSYLPGRPTVTTVKSGEGALGPLQDSDSAQLFVLGHGNFGAGIGTHKTHFGARRMVQLLLNDGLGKVQTGLTIYLWACNSGVEMGRVFFNKDSYAKRLATRMAEAGFSNTRIVGFIGFVTGAGRLVLGANLHTGAMHVNAGPVNPMTETARQVIYSVNNGGCVLISGPRWKSTINPFNRNCVISQIT
jgi:autotransporter-associated beta strand protein